MRVNPHLSFNGQCEEAFRFYADCLGGTIAAMMTYGESPAAGQTPAAWHKKLIHCTLALGDQRITGADALPPHYEKPQGFSVFLNLDIADGQRVFDALAEKGTVQMPFQETFWAARFGMVIDRFGTPWIVNCRKAVLGT
jgi:PhnB protein